MTSTESFGASRIFRAAIVRPSPFRSSPSASCWRSEGCSFVIVASLWLRYRARLYDSVYFLKACVATAPLGFVAVLAGWTMTEVGRQPWTVYGLLRTAESVTPSLTGFDVLLSLLGYMAAYLVIFPAGIFFMARVVRHGPVESNDALPVEGGRPRVPVTQAE
jgi:cytochrome d ubiquinol oxidase subunit I